MSCLENDKFMEVIEDIALDDFIDAYEREPTESELEDHIQTLLERYL